MTAAMREAGEVWPGTGASVLYLPVEGQVPGGALSDRESAVYAAFRLEKRRREWLAGRLAAKALLSADGPAPAACDIGMDKFGRPCCGQALVSISHSNGWALAAVKPGSQFLGADLEKIEERHPAWYSDYFHPAELASRDPSEATRLWTVKEALLKALGLGLMADPLDIRTGERVMLSGKALERYREMGSPRYSVETRNYPAGFWTAVAA
ncbi:MAG: 4'-phosphopantetheinyl transferase superfamily protein [Elusimicrobia bacterium]|nr:4'-phosphopantetheinyl transferase superfamily protein [Elusimicrobiota bacterium]